MSPMSQGDYYRRGGNLQASKGERFKRTHSPGENSVWRTLGNRVFSLWTLEKTQEKWRKESHVFFGVCFLPSSGNKSPVRHQQQAGTGRAIIC